MRSRFPALGTAILGLSLVALVAVSARLVAAPPGGTATGKLTVNGKPVTLEHAYARKVMGATRPDSDQFELRAPEEGETAAEGVLVVLTDQPLPVDDLTYVSAVEGALRDGQVQGISWVVDDKRQAQRQSLHHGALGSEVPGRPDVFEVSRLDARVAGKAFAEADFFDDAWTYDVTFDAPVAALPKPSMQPGTAAGTLTVDGKVYELRHAYARTEPGAFDAKKKDIVLHLVDAPVGAAAFADRFAPRDLIKAGKLHGLTVTIDASGRVISGGFHLAELEFASSTGWQQLEPILFEAGKVEGRLYSQGAHEIMGHELVIDARFNVAAK
jgi:hypothetical protein